MRVGSFGDGRINMYDLGSHALPGHVTEAAGAPLIVDGLWALPAGNGGSADKATSALAGRAPPATNRARSASAGGPPAGIEVFEGLTQREPQTC